MKLENAIKKLSNVTRVQQNGNQFWGELNRYVVEFCVNGRIEDDRDIVCIRIRSKKDKDDSMTDYCAGTWCDSLTQAIRMAS